MNAYLTVTPAYARDYRTAKEAKEAWESGKDFVVADAFSPWCGSYINKEGALNGEVRTVNIRFDSLRKVAVVNLRVGGR